MSPPALRSPVNTLRHRYGWREDDGNQHRSKGEANQEDDEDDRDVSLLSLFLTLALGIANFLGYLVIMFHEGRTEVPIVTKEFEETVRNNRFDLKPELWFNVRPFKPWLAALFCNIMFCVIHSANFEPIPLLYAFTFCVVTLPWTLVCLRRAILVPYGRTRRLQRWYCLAFEIVVSRPIFRNHVILQCFAVLGFYRSEFFTLMLLDVLNINKTLRGIIKSVSAPGFSLLMVFYLYIVTITIYASFGENSFHKYLAVPGFDDELGEESESRKCSFTLSCFHFLFYSQLAGSLGKLLENLRTVDQNSNEYSQRMVYDSMFFIWVGLVFANIITGLMIDTFSSIREEEADRAQVFETECFVCGVTRSSYEDLNLGKKCATFKQHQDTEHDPWTYVSYLVYLRSKDKTEYNGIEAYVVSCVEKRSTDWIPNATSAAIEAHKHGDTRQASNSDTPHARRQHHNHHISQNGGVPQATPSPRGSSHGGGGGDASGGGGCDGNEANWEGGHGSSGGQPGSGHLTHGGGGGGGVGDGAALQISHLAAAAASSAATSAAAAVSTSTVAALQRSVEEIQEQQRKQLSLLSDLLEARSACVPTFTCLGCGRWS